MPWRGMGGRLAGLEPATFGWIPGTEAIDALVLLACSVICLKRGPTSRLAAVPDPPTGGRSGCWFRRAHRPPGFPWPAVALPGSGCVRSLEPVEPLQRCSERAKVLLGQRIRTGVVVCPVEEVDRQLKVGTLVVTSTRMICSQSPKLRENARPRHSRASP